MPAEEPSKEKHRSGGVGRRNFPEADRGASRNIVLAGSARCCCALRVIRHGRLHASQGGVPLKSPAKHVSNSFKPTFRKGCLLILVVLIADGAQDIFGFCKVVLF
ncbi:hypothetical protein [uncultured Mailhella sp.]|uniref:hypothetical protein n=1 Tax=uncultured Mailhella sp. TaxID=1981031 RepID=UPI0025DB89B6|nr:hypothetical protein [uncultured Mailhella sp.]